MSKKLIPLLVMPLALVSCGRSSLTLNEAKNVVSGFSTEAEYPYYKVIGSLDFNGELLRVNATFDQPIEEGTFVPYVRYNDGFYNKTADKKNTDFDILIYSMASRSYWLRAPLKISSENFFAYAKDKSTGEFTSDENTSCAHYILEHLITSFVGQAANANPSSMSMYMVRTSDGGLAFGGDAVHTEITIDNYPFYPDYNNIPELGEWDDSMPLPCYKNRINAKVNIRFEYNKDGWLVRETMSSIGYDSNVAKKDQVSLDALYVYDFGE